MAVLVAAGVAPTKGRAADLLDSIKALSLGRLINVRRITSSATYIETAGTKSIIVDLTGAGAGGGGVPATAAGQLSVAGGGAPVPEPWHGLHPDSPAYR